MIASSFSASRGSLLTLNVRHRCGFKPCSTAHQIAPFLLQIFEGVLFKHGMSLEKPIQRGTRFVAQPLPQLRLGEMPAFELFSANASPARRDKSPPAAVSRAPRSSGTWTVTFMALFRTLTRSV